MEEVKDLKLYDIELRIYYNYYKGESQTNDYCGSPDVIEIEEIHHLGEDIYNIIDPNDIELIKKIIKDEI